MIIEKSFNGPEYTVALLKGLYALNNQDISNHEIAELAKAVLAEGRKAIGGKAKLNVGVSTFVPKPHTPFQWSPSDSLEQIKLKQRLLRREVRGRGLKLNLNKPHETMMESWLSRGDRRLGNVILEAYKNGAKFDGWWEHLSTRIPPAMKALDGWKSHWDASGFPLLVH